MKKQVFEIENLGCAHCAAKMENKINELAEVDECTLTFATKQLSIKANDPNAVLPKIQEICKKIEDQVEVHEMDRSHANGDEDSDKKDWITLLVSGVLLAILLILEHMVLTDVSPIYMGIAYAIPYLLLGSKILLAAAKGIGKGQIFDENFLMAIATIGAFAIGDFAEAVGVMLFFRIGEFFEDRAVKKSRRAVMEAVDMRPETVNLDFWGDIKEIPAEMATPGDLILVRAGDRIPLDGVITKGESRIDTSPVTGEPVPVKVSVGDTVTSGCINTSGVLTVKVVNGLKDSMVTKILDAVENAAAGKPKMDRFISRFAKVYTPIVVFTALATAIIPSLITGNWSHWIYTALTFLVISCPCALVLSVPLAFFAGIGVGSRKGILFKGGSSLEALTKVKAIVMDKTGTVTEGNFKVQEIATCQGFSVGDVLTAALALEQSSTHPIAESIVAAGKEKSLSSDTASNIQEIAGKGLKGAANGSEILAGNEELMKLNSISVDELASTDYGTTVYIGIDGKLAGAIYLSDTLKATTKTAISKLNALGLQTVMLTGDNDKAAKHIAHEAGIKAYFSGLLPEGKLEHLEGIRKQYGPVMFVGDGINDAPVLAGADVGAAMGSGADAAIDASDVVFMTSDMEAVHTSLQIAKRINRTAKVNIIFALAIKAAVMILGLMGIANRWFAVFADSGVAMICVLNSVRILWSTNRKSNSKVVLS